MKRNLRFAVIGIAAAAALLAGMFRAEAQAPQGYFGVLHQINPLGAVITNTAQAPATVNSAAIQMGGYDAIRCTFNQVSHTGSPSTTIAIQVQDPLSLGWESVITSGAITADATPTSVSAGSHTATTANISAGTILTRAVRVQEVVSTGGATTTGTVGCVQSR
jgi:hypothetical protein